MPSEAKKKQQQKKKEAAKARQQTASKPAASKSVKTDPKKANAGDSENVENGINGTENGILVDGN